MFFKLWNWYLAPIKMGAIFFIITLYRTPAYLNSFVPLSTTPKPLVIDESAILLGLTPNVQNNIPDGYELVPLDKLTDEYEVVPWNQVQSLLNVTNVPGMSPYGNLGQYNSINVSV